VKKGKSVIADIGSGTGFLSFLASRLGAKECYLYEQSALLNVSRRLAKENGIRNCHFIQKHSTEVRNPPKADIVISETLGNFALEENILETMNDTRRFLKTGGTLIPQSLTQFVAPLTTDTLWREVTSWDRVGSDLSFAAAREVSINNVYVRTIRRADILPQKNAIQEWDHVDFRQENSSIRSSTVEWKIQKRVTIYGFAVWWEATLVPGIILSTDPTSPRTHWEQVYLPVRDPVKTECDDILSLHLRSDSRYEVKINVAWEVRCSTASGHERTRQHMDMCQGYV
jgi:protein arginine N-methyltransferase 1